MNRAERGRAGRKAGAAAEWVVALWLIATGWRILGFRLRTRHGEIDILARRGAVLAAVEVKRRGDIDAALDALSDRQGERLWRALQTVMARRPALRALTPRIDLIAMAPGRWPRRIAGHSPGR